MARKIIGVLGMGIFGKTIAQELSRFDQEVIAVDNKEANIEDIADVVTKAVVGDITDNDFLKAIGIDQCDTVIVATGENLEASVLAVLHCKKLGVPTIIAKAKTAIYEEVLYGIGATRVITPERDSGKALASNLLRRHIENIIHLEENVSMVEFIIPQAWVGKSLSELGIRKKFNLNLVGIRHNKQAGLDTNINPNQPFEAGTDVVAIATGDTFEKLDYLGYFR